MVNENHKRIVVTHDIDVSESGLAKRKECYNKLKNDKTDIDDLFEYFLKKTTEKDGEQNDDDPQYVEFLKNLSVNGKSYKLAIYKNNNFSHFIKYEEHEEEDEELDGYDPLTFEFDDNGDKTDTGELMDISEASRKNKNNKDVTFVSGYTPDKQGGYILNLNGINVTYENKPTTSSDSDIQILENINDFSEVESHTSLKEKVLSILRKPYSKNEYEQLLVYLEKKKPICRTLPLRGRDISSALEKEGKSLIDKAHVSFRRKLAAAKREGQQPKIINLMRMYRFWLEHPDPDDEFQPWFDEDCLKVQEDSVELVAFG